MIFKQELHIGSFKNSLRPFSPLFAMLDKEPPILLLKKNKNIYELLPNIPSLRVREQIHGSIWYGVCPDWLFDPAKFKDSRTTMGEEAFLHGLFSFYIYFVVYRSDADNKKLIRV